MHPRPPTRTHVLRGRPLRVKTSGNGRVCCAARGGGGGRDDKSWEEGKALPAGWLWGNQTGRTCLSLPAQKAARPPLAAHLDRQAALLDRPTEDGCSAIARLLLEPHGLRQLFPARRRSTADPPQGGPRESTAQPTPPSRFSPRSVTVTPPPQPTLHPSVRSPTRASPCRSYTRSVLNLVAQAPRASRRCNARTGD